MDRYVLYNNKIINKLISSKMVYAKKKNILNINRLVLSAHASSITQDITAAVMPLVFGRRPAFLQKRNDRTNAYINTRILFTLSKDSIYRNLNLVVQTMLLSQLENNIYLVNFATNNQVTWTMHTCRPPTQLKVFFDKYPLTTDAFSMSLNLNVSSCNVYELVYRLRTLQMPVQEYKIN